MKKLEFKMCRYDGAFTMQEMREETGRCGICKLDCPNAEKKKKRQVKD